MSCPLTNCLISKAARGNEGALNSVLEAMKINKRYGHFMIAPCPHTPPCEQPTDDQLVALNDKVVEATKGIKYES